MMKPDGPIDYAVFQLSPRRSRCELLISSNGNTEKLASGLIKPFVAQLKVAKEQFAKMVQCIKLEVGKGKCGETWFTRGTLERFVRFVSTPEILERASDFDAEMSQLEAARKIYLQESRHSVASGEDETGIALTADATKKELLRAIDVRLAAVQQQLATACARACAAGFHLDSVSELMLFADCFGAVRLNEACTKFLSLCQRRPDLVPTSRKIASEQVRSSCESDMSLDDLVEDLTIPMKKQQVNQNCSSTYQESCYYEKNEIHLEQLKTTSDQLESSSSFVTERKNDKQRTEDNDKKDQQSDSEPIQTSLPTRRLSVQDRINLFESKQKENFGAGSGSGSGSSSKPVVGKSVELRRLSSDVSTTPSAIEKAVLRRWSGTSDMSIDLSADKKDCGDSPLCTPSSTSVSLVDGHAASNPLEDWNLKGHHDGAGSLKFNSNILKAEIVVTGPKNQSDSLTNAHLSSKDEGSTVKECFTVQDSLSSQARSAVREQQRGTSYEENTEEKAGSLSGSRGGNAKQQMDSEVRLMGSARQNDVASLGSGAASASNAPNTTSNSSRFSHKVETGRMMDNDRPKDPRASQFKIRGLHGHSRSFSWQLEGSSGLKYRDIQEKVSGGDKLAEQPRGRSFAGESEETTWEVGCVEKVQMGAEEFSIQNMKSSKPVPVGSEQIKRPHIKRDDGGFSNADGKPALSSRKISQSHESTVPAFLQSEQLQRARQSRGNQELNDELKMKANELEKLFAQHKLRVPNDQSSATRRNKAADLQKESTGSSQMRKASSTEAAPGSLPEKSIVPEARVQAGSASSFSTPPSMKFADVEESSSTLRRNFSNLSYSDESRGKFYEKYMKRRDAKLREEWGSKRAEKEAKLKAMHDRLEQSTAEMKAKFSGSADRQQPSYTTSHRAEKVRSSNGRTNVREQQMDLNQSEEKETGMFSELHSLDLFNESHGVDLASRSMEIKKGLHNRDLGSSNTHSTAMPVSRSSAKASYSSGRQKEPHDNPLSQSVPDISELRKENTKSSLGFSEAAPRTQARGHTRSRSKNEDMPLVKEDRTRRTQSVLKGSANPAECNNLSTSKFDRNVVDILEVDQDKGNGTITVRKGRDARLKAVSPSEKTMDECSNDSDSMADHMLVMSRGEDDEERDPVAVPNVGTMHDGKSRLGPESDYSQKCGSGNGDSLTSLSRVNPATAADLAASMSLKYQAGDPLRDSPNESPLSWKSRVHHLFAYPHDTSDIDAPVDPPAGSPASWNSHTLGQIEGDSAHLRKKWGNAANPSFIADTSHGHSRKDVTNGFKRLLKFGRKSRGSESLVDWISVTTSEGDDDTEDEQDSANWSSEDLRKLRMGFQQGRPSDNSLNESKLLNDHVKALRSSIPAPPANFKLQEDLFSGNSLKGANACFDLGSPV